MRFPISKIFGIAALVGGVIIGPALKRASVLAEENCEKLYADYLQKAKQALVDKKADLAVEYLLKASAIAGTCPNSVRPEGQSGQNALASASYQSTIYR